MMSIAVYALLSILSFSLLVYRVQSRPSLPPGPRPLPLIGNIFDLPKKDDWIHWLQLGERYGPLIFVRALRTPIVVINKLDICIDMLDKRSADYSGRPILHFVSKMVGWDRQMLLAQPDKRHRTMRRMVARHFGTQETAAEYHGVQEDEARTFVLAVEKHPHDVIRLIHRSVTAVLIRISHGYKIDREGVDPLMTLVDRSVHEFDAAAKPGAWMVDLVPLLGCLPDWLPGMGFKRVAANFRATLDQIMAAPLSFVKDQMENPDGVPSFSSRMLQSDLDPLEKELLPSVSSALYAAGPDPVTTALSTCILAMLLYPDVQKRLQLELDTAFGRACIPPSSELAKLPYLRALMLEVLRWHTVASINIPHAASNAGTFMSYYIPKNTIILANLQAFAHDEAYYRDPFTFEPKRFLGPSPELESTAYAFGFGKRICPGSGLALELLVFFIATLFSVFDVVKSRDDNGVEITPKAEFESGAVCPPKPFPCVLKPRSVDAEALLRALKDDQNLTCEQGDASKLHF